MIIMCSFLYEEIFNTSLNNSQIPIRDNIQPLEDIFHNNQNKYNKSISLVVNIINHTCKIIRAGKGLHSYINSNLFDLFPLHFKQYQINLFMNRIFENYENEENNDKNNKVISNKDSKFSTKIIKTNLNIINNNKTKKDYLEIKFIFCENIDSKIYYKLLTLKLTPLFNNINPYFVLFDGIYNINPYTIITLKDLEENKRNEKERIISVSDPKFF